MDQGVINHAIERGDTTLVLLLIEREQDRETRRIGSIVAAAKRQGRAAIVEAIKARFPDAPDTSWLEVFSEHFAEPDGGPDEKRTKAQNSYLWGGAYAALMEVVEAINKAQPGWRISDQDDLHEYLLAHFAFGKRSKQMSYAQFNEYLDNLALFGERYGAQIPHPITIIGKDKADE